MPPDAQAVPSTYIGSATVMTGSSRHFPKFILIIIILLVIAGLAAGGYLYVPTLLSKKFAADLKPKVSALKNSFKDVKDSIDQIHNLAITPSNPAQQDGSLKTSRLPTTPKALASGRSSNVLGVSTGKSLGLVEQITFSWIKQLSGINNLTTSDETRILGVQTTDTSTGDDSVRQMKDAAVKAQQDIAKVKQSMADLQAVIKKPPLLVTANIRDKVINNRSLENDVNPYLDEAGKVTNYYNVVSDALLAMSTKMQSFRNSINSITAVLSSSSAASSPDNAIKQMQIYLDQAKTDSDDMKKLADTLSQMSAGQLPTGAQEYHQHVIKVLNVVQGYFDNESKLMQDLLQALQSFIDKTKSRRANTIDFLQFKSQITTIIQTSSLSDTKFISDLNVLTGEESSLAMTFWTNNNILNKQAQVETDINNLDKVISDP